MTTDTLIDVPEDEFVLVEGDYRKACVPTAVCPWCGLVGTLVCCNTPTGRHGMAEGFKDGMMGTIVVGIVVGVLVVTAAVNCKSDMTGTDTDKGHCSDISGAYYNETSEICYFNGHCPSRYTYEDSERDGVLGWCRNDDHYSCLFLLFPAMPWVNAGISVVFWFVAFHYAKKFYRHRATLSSAC